MTRWEVTVAWPLTKPLPSLANARLHWAARARLVKAQRAVATLHLVTQGRAWLEAWRVMAGNEALRIEATLTRVAPRRLDDDNLQASMKATRDSVAAWVGLDDGSPRWVWRYGQEKGAPGVRVRLVVLQRGEA